MKQFTCHSCGITFTPKSHGTGEYKYCSRKCFHLKHIPWNKGIIGEDSHAFGNDFAKGVIPWNKGKKVGSFHTKESLENIRIANTGENSHNWKGEDVSYYGLHAWVQREKGTPQGCINCGTINGRMHWANISGEYKRDLDDFMRLCVKCHKNYDLGNIIIKHWEK